MSFNAPSRCFLEWHPFRLDRFEGLNHQLSSIGCALAEAHFARRTFVLPAGGFCSRHGRASEAGLHCIPWRELLDLELLSQLSPVLEAESLPAGLTVLDVDQGKAWNWSSPAVRAIPCNSAPLVRRRMGVHWFSPCFWHRTHSVSLLREAWQAIAGVRPGGALKKPWLTTILHLLRSGLWFSSRIKGAATAVRKALGGGGYLAIHVRRGDRLRPPQCKRASSVQPCTAKEDEQAHAVRTRSTTVNSPCAKSAAMMSCSQLDQLTRPIAIQHALSQWVSNSTTIFIGSDEPSTFFQALRSEYRVVTIDDVMPVLRAHAITHPSFVYAVETLVMFGAQAMVETYDYYIKPTREACFPAAAAIATRQPLALPSSQITISCQAPETAVVNGVLFGPACVRLQKCGGLQLAPRARPCEAVLRDMEERNSCSEGILSRGTPLLAASKDKDANLPVGPVG